MLYIKAGAAKMAGAWFIHRPVWLVRPVRGLYRPVTGRIVVIYANLGLHDFICNMPAWKQIWIYTRRGATQPAAGLKPKASAQRYGTIHATSVFGATVYKTVRHMLSDHCPVCLSVLSVTLVYCGQTVGWIKTKLGTEVGLCPDHTVLDGD